MPDRDRHKADSLFSAPSALAADNRALSENLVGTALVVVSAAGFSTLGIFGKLAYGLGLNLPSILAFRFLGTAALLWAWLLWRDRWKLTFQQAITATLLGAIGYAVQATLFFAALLHTGVGIATLLLYTYPAFVTLLAWIVEKETPDRYRQAALGVALIGCTLTADVSQATVAPLGILFGLASGLWYSIYLTFGARLVKSVEPIATSAYVSLGAAFSFSLATLTISQFTLPSNLAGVSVITGTILLATAIPIVTLFAAIQKIGTTRSAIVSTIEPVFAVVLGFVFLNEKLEGNQLIGGLMVVASVGLANLGRRPLSG